MRSSLLIFTLLFSLSGYTQVDQACLKAYDKMYGDGELRMSLFYGYADSGDDVDDRLTKVQMIEKITQKCPETADQQLCGFQRNDDDADVFTKTIVRASGKSEKVRFKLMSSSVSTSNKRNMGQLKAEQDQQSRQTEEAYYSALKTDDVVLYNGHARRGTGPGFRPMGSKDWVSAVTTKYSLQRTTAALKSAKQTPAIIGMITCEGEEHYGQALQNAAPKSGLLLTRQTTAFVDSDAITETTLENVLQKRCATTFRNTLQNSVQYIYSSPLDGADSYKDKLPEIYNFFEPNKKKFAAPRGAILTLINGEFEESTTRQEEAARERGKQQPQKATNNPR